MTAQTLGIFGDIVNGISSIFSGIANWISDKIGQWLDYFIAVMLKFVYEILKVFFLLLDFIQLVFRKMAGLDTVYMNGEAYSGDLALLFFRNENVINALIALMVVAVVLIFVCTFIAIIRNHYNAKNAGETAVGPVIGKAFKALFTFIFVPLVCYFGVYVSNGLLKTIDQATRISNALTISGEVFVSSGINANRARIDTDFATKLANDSSLNFGGVFVDDSNLQYTNSQTAADKIDDAFAQKLAANGHTITASEDDYSFMFHQSSPGSISNFDYMNTDLVFVYYDLQKFNWLFAFVSCFFIMATLLVASLGVIQRLFEITILFAISPPFIALMPLDNGNAYKKWAGKFISNVLVMYGTVVALNFFFIIAPVLQSIDLFGSPEEIAAYGDLTCTLFNGIAHILFIMCGAMMIKDFSKLVTDLVGGGPGLEDRGRGVQGAIQGAVGAGARLVDNTAGRAHRAYNNYYSEENVKKRDAARKQKQADKAAKETQKNEHAGFKAATQAQYDAGEINRRTKMRMDREHKHDLEGKTTLKERLVGRNHSAAYDAQVAKAKAVNTGYQNRLKTKTVNRDKSGVVGKIKNPNVRLRSAVREDVRQQYYKTNATQEAKEYREDRHAYGEVGSAQKAETQKLVKGGMKPKEAKKQARDTATYTTRKGNRTEKELKSDVKESAKNLKDSRKNLK